jgi:protein transport protein SEC9
VIRVVEKLANTERHLDISKNHSLRAEDNTDELKKLNRSIFRPAITFNKDAKRAAKEAKIQARFEEDRSERERTLTDIRESKNTVGNASRGMGGNRQELTTTQQAMRKEQRSRYQFEATNSDDEAEDELDDNLSEIGDATKRLKALGMAMGQEIDTQNKRIDRISDKATTLDSRMFTNTEKVSLCLHPIFWVPSCSPSCSSSASGNPSILCGAKYPEGLFTIVGSC